MCVACAELTTPEGEAVVREDKAGRPEDDDDDDVLEWVAAVAGGGAIAADDDDDECADDEGGACADADDTPRCPLPPPPPPPARGASPRIYMAELASQFLQPTHAQCSPHGTLAW